MISLIWQCLGIVSAVPEKNAIFDTDIHSMVRTAGIILIFSLLSASLIAQDIDQKEYESHLFDPLFESPSGSPEVKIIQERKLDELLIRYMEQNRKLGGIPCYWIRIYSGSSHAARQEAYDTKARFLKKYDGIRNEVRYDDPNFKVYVGGYRTKSEALKLLKKIRRDFRTAFIVYDIIDFPQN
jgi:hypothetical protein